MIDQSWSKKFCDEDEMERRQRHPPPGSRPARYHAGHAYTTKNHSAAPMLLWHSLGPCRPPFTTSGAHGHRTRQSAQTSPRLPNDATQRRTQSSSFCPTVVQLDTIDMDAYDLPCWTGAGIRIARRPEVAHPRGPGKSGGARTSTFPMRFHAV